ncbi:MAG TPA: cytochrome c-type biogenesis protein [Longimicrobium sp.]|jgi:cytochrome c-type biogenesis protein CcmH
MRIAFAALLLAALAAPAGAQVERRLPPEVEAVAHRAMTELRSPVTPSHTLDMCPAEAAIALRDTVRMAALQGQSSNQIVEGVVARYGERLRTVPRRDDFGVWAWLAPPLVLLLGAGAVVLAMRRLRGRAATPIPATAMSDEDRARLDAALRAYERGEAGV